MEAYRELAEAFVPVQRAFLESPGVQRALARDISVVHYACFLREVFHHTRENPQIQTLATVYFRGHQREAIKRFFRHAASEIGHDSLALDDLRELGVDATDLPRQNPLPETAALIAFPFHQIYNLNPVGYLGYLYFLEFLPTGSGNALMAALSEVGVPETAMRFLRDHTIVDRAHNEHMRSYARILLTNARELASAVYAMRVTGALYARMIEGAFAHADAPGDWGWSSEECVEESPFAAARETGEYMRPAADVHAIVMRESELGVTRLAR